MVAEESRSLPRFESSFAICGVERTDDLTSLCFCTAL